MTEQINEEKPVSEEFRRAWDTWQQKTWELYQRWMREEGLTVDQCNERFWGKDLIKRWKAL